ncbi:hypothetical protein V6R21_29170 [Limibacter armeniacum]|uniref:hypothetical protein n=1 Tax=Limibacter armeniacum TaxID=466084 RepID=UPI002FE5B26C
MKLIEITNKELIKEFLEFPVRLYKDDPNYIRPLDKDVESVFDLEQNKLFKRGGKAIRWILKNGTGKTIGRVAAYINPMTVNKDESLPTGSMGFFDCINDQQAANMLFDTCKNWLMEQGVEAMDGPVNLGDRDKWWGCLAEGYTEPNYCMHYNFPYYNDLYQNYGFGVFFKQYTYHRLVPDTLDEKLINKGEVIYNNPDYHFEHMKISNLMKYAKDFSVIYTKAWTKHEGVKGIDEKQAAKIFKTMKPILDEEIAWFGYYKDEPVAFYLQIPEMNQIIRNIKDGKFGVWNKLKMFYHVKRKTSRKLFGLVFGVVPEHQRKGVEAGIILAYSNFIQEKLKKQGKASDDPAFVHKGYHYNELEMNWIGDFNPKMMRTAELIGGKIFKTHITYRKLFDETREFKRMTIID